ncbi:hypothetical protein [Desulfobacterium sp. N47]|uniref:Uncharacterized protein n=1 Tax=uncultured Desulfobacterium sp. TaxID=201089 RepID=E1YEL9_9BACT|nr:hypothetical protein N47_P17180 [uncultured Desulfobacterium sp.]
MSIRSIVIEARLGNYLYNEHIISAHITLALLPAVNQAELIMPASVQMDASSGDDAVISIDGGDGMETVLTGKIYLVHKSIYETKVIVADAGFVLNAARPAKTFDKQDAATIVKTLAADCGVDIDKCDVDIKPAFYIAHQNRTSAEHIADLVKHAGGYAAVSAQGALTATTWPSDSDINLTFGREIREYCTKNKVPVAYQIIATGSGPAGTIDAADAKRPTAKPIPTDAPEPGNDARWVPVHMLRTPDAVTTSKKSLNSRQGAYASMMEAKTLVMPALRPGACFSAQQMPDNLSQGPWYCTKLSHHLSAHSLSVTTIEAITSDSSSLSSAGGLI